MDLREVRFKKRISQWELNKQTGVHQSRISLIENGHIAKKDEKQKIAEALKVNIDDIDW
jgi:predicted transcriptional regulator